MKKALTLFNAWENTRNKDRPLGTESSFLAFTQFMSRNEELYKKNLLKKYQKQDVRMAFQYFTKIQKAEPSLTKAA